MTCQAALLAGCPSIPIGPNLVGDGNCDRHMGEEPVVTYAHDRVRPVRDSAGEQLCGPSDEIRLHGVMAWGSG